MTAQTYTSVTSPAASTAKGRRRGLNITVWVAQALFAAFFVFASVPKILGDDANVASFEQIGAGQWFRVVTGLVELAGAIGLVVPRLSSLAAAGLAIVMLCATWVNQVPLDMPLWAGVNTIVFAAAFAAIAWYRRDQNRRLLELIGR
ncbi:DoxX family protein [Glycomyces tenuis]|uniref:DoxX family protein n=1 Tax=Glycomyces tenuis TaxID=58116 RepID=UPI0004022DD9|nr:DoxX family protein [Glycomyces tenuis]